MSTQPVVALCAEIERRALLPSDRQMVVTRINWLRVTVVVVAVAVVVLLEAGRFLGLQNVGLTGHFTAATSPGSRPAAQMLAGTQLAAPTPQLVMTTVLEGTDDELPLGISVRGPRDGAAVEITGLPPGSALSSGRPFGEAGWRITAAEASGATIRPPRRFAGPVDLAVELRLPDDTLVERRMMRREWLPPARIETPRPPTQAGGAPSAAPPTTTASTGESAIGPPAAAQVREPDPDQIDFEQVALFLRRGGELFSVGDLSGARVMLERAAKAGNADAALLLGGTYDPTLFNRFEPGGDAVDAVTARTWYEMAKRLGSLEARRRLNALTRRAPWSDLPSRP